MNREQTALELTRVAKLMAGGILDVDYTDDQKQQILGQIRRIAKLVK